MQVSDVSNQLKDLINQAKKILVVTQKDPSFDGFAAALGLYHVLSSLKKEVVLACAGEAPPGISSLPGSEKFVTSVGPRNLVISFDYAEGSIEKVSYNIEGNRFNLVISPRDGVVNPDQIQYSYSGSNFDLIFILDTPSLANLGKLYEQERYLYSSAPTINVDRHDSNTQFGKINLLDPSASSVSEILASLAKIMGVNCNEAAANCWLSGIKVATNNFSQAVSAETFEAAATCARSLGKQAVTPGSFSFSQDKKPPASPPTFSADSSSKVSSGRVNDVRFEGEDSSHGETEADQSWFSPKIYKSSEDVK
jgi:nanoRNase/pAp phosphatase (c-di-AMP/oligoRNAs hydrolase)